MNISDEQLRLIMKRIENLESDGKVAPHYNARGNTSTFDGITLAAWLKVIGPVCGLLLLGFTLLWNNERALERDINHTLLGMSTTLGGLQTGITDLNHNVDKLSQSIDKLNDRIDRMHDREVKATP